MKVLLVGVGRFGAGWYRLLKDEYPALHITSVDVDADRAARILDPGDPFYTGAGEAIERENPDFVLIATPPAAHTRLNHLAFDYGLPVLCEKPIAEDYREAAEIVGRSEREAIPFMIAENYRRFPIARKVKQLLAEGAIGEPTSIRVQFFQALFTDKPYLLAMADPLLVDVSIHHLDMVRYLTGSEGRRIFAHAYNPARSPYHGRAAADLILEMANGTVVNYAGNLAARGGETDWKGHWRIEGPGGVITATDRIELVQDGQASYFSGFEPGSLRPALDEFLAALEGGYEPETSGRDYLKSQHLVQCAVESSRFGRPVKIESN